MKCPNCGNTDIRLIETMLMNLREDGEKDGTGMLIEPIKYICTKCKKESKNKNDFRIMDAL